MRFSIVFVSVVFLIVFLTLRFVGYRDEARDDVDRVSPKTPASPMETFIVPHHLLAEDDIREMFRLASENRKTDPVMRVVLVSPNHFSVGRSWVIGSGRDWDAPDGVLLADRAAISFLNRDNGGLVEFDDDILEREHGVRGLLPFVKEYFPQAAVVPLALRDSMPDAAVDALADTLSQFDGRTILVVSVDFSHYLDWNFSRFHDEKSIEILEAGDLDRIKRMDVDCLGCLRLAVRYADSKSAGNFHLVSRTSTLESVGRNVVGEETSHITGYFSVESLDMETRQDPATHLLFSGRLDPSMMTDTARRIFMSQDGNIHDVGNDVYVGTFDDMYADDGQYISAGQLLLADNVEVSTLVPHREKVAFVEASDIGSVARIVDARKQNDIVIAYWKSLLANRSEWVSRSHALIDAGADVVIGKQGSGIGSLEIYRDRPIFTSLGDPVSCVSMVGCGGIVLGVSFSPDRAEYFLMPVIADERGVFELVDQERRGMFLEKLISDGLDMQTRFDVLGGAFSMDRLR